MLTYFPLLAHILRKIFILTKILLRNNAFGSPITQIFRPIALYVYSSTCEQLCMIMLSKQNMNFRLTGEILAQNLSFLKQFKSSSTFPPSFQLLHIYLTLFSSQCTSTLFFEVQQICLNFFSAVKQIA